MILACPLLMTDRIERNDMMLDLVHFSDELIISYALSIGVIRAPAAGIMGDISELTQHWEANTNYLDPEESDWEATLLYHLDTVTEYLFWLLDHYLSFFYQTLGLEFYRYQTLLRSYGFTTIRTSTNMCFIIINDTVDIHHPLFASLYDHVTFNPLIGEITSGTDQSVTAPCFGPQTHRLMAALFSRGR